MEKCEIYANMCFCVHLGFRYRLGNLCDTHLLLSNLLSNSRITQR